MSWNIDLYSFFFLCLLLNLMVQYIWLAMPKKKKTNEFLCAAAEGERDKPTRALAMDGEECQTIVAVQIMSTWPMWF